MGKITVIALGPGDPGLLTLDGARLLKSAQGGLVLRTGRHGCAGFLRDEGIGFDTLDWLYDEAEDYDALADRAAEALISRAEASDVVYAVADVRDSSVEALMMRCPEVAVVPGVPVDAPLMARAPRDYLALPASAYAEQRLSARRPILVRELDNALMVSELKLKLLEIFPAAHPVFMTGPGCGAARRLELQDIDRQAEYDHTMCLLVPALPDFLTRERHDIEDLMDIVAVLASPGGCPWDRQQTHETIKGNLIEEAYEVLDAIDQGDMDALYDELGDVLLQVVLHADIARRHGEFDMGEVTSAIVGKLIHRHPHVFADTRADTAGEVLRNWEQIKGEDRGQQTVTESMRQLTRGLPALMRAHKVQKRAARVGFDFEDAAQAFEKVREEAQEAAQALEAGEHVEEELGDLLFATVNVIRLAGLDSERAMDLATRKFIDRFAALEEAVITRGGKLEGMTLSEMDEVWEEIKRSRR